MWRHSVFEFMHLEMHAKCEIAYAIHTRLVHITSRKFMFIQESQLKRCPFMVSEFLSSTMMGEPTAARKSDKGSMTRNST